MITTLLVFSCYPGKPEPLVGFWTLQCSGKYTIHLAVTFSVSFFSPQSDLRKAAPLAPMSGSKTSHEVEVIRAQESFAFETASHFQSPYTLASTWKPSYQLLLLMPFMSLVFFFLSYPFFSTD